MTNNLTGALIATMVGATVLTPVAHGQTSSELAQSGEHCEALRTLSTEQSDRLRPEWVEESRSIIEAGEEQRCLALYEQATEALGPDPQDREAAARIVVTQPDPQVEVQQRAPLVSVTQQEPQVRVDQGQPQVIVRQAAPNVRVQIPQPIITIDQPQPEIIVRMPEPDVAVTSPEPQVEVRQREPQVDVTQPEPRVSVQPQEGTPSQQEADVQLQQQEPEVQIEGVGTEAQIDVQREQPNVQYQAAEPNIEVEQQGEPQVRFNQTGEPQIRIEQATGDPGEQPQTDQQQPAQQQPADQQQRDTTPPAPPPPDATSEQQQAVDTDRANRLLSPDQRMEAGRPLEYEAADLSGRELRNARGEELGTVDRVVVSGDRQYLVLTEGGFLGFGEREVAIPLDSVSVIEGRLVMRGMSQEDIEAMPEFDSAGAQPVGQDERVLIGTP